jgi:hypothetical protein
MCVQGNTFGAEEARTTILTNVAGTHAVTQALLPALRARGAIAGGPGARVVNVCSMAGKLRIIRDARLARRFQDATTAEEARMLSSHCHGARMCALMTLLACTVNCAGAGADG